MSYGWKLHNSHNVYPRHIADIADDDVVGNIWHISWIDLFNMEKEFKYKTHLIRFIYSNIHALTSTAVYLNRRWRSSMKEWLHLMALGSISDRCPELNASSPERPLELTSII